MKPIQVGFNHCGELSGEILSGVRCFTNTCASAESERAALESHLFGTFKRQPFGGQLARQNPPRSRPAVAPARKDQLAVREFRGNVLGINLRYQ